MMKFPFARDFILVRIFYQPYLIYMPSLVEIPLAVSDISEVKDFDICSRFLWQRRPFWKFQDLMAPLDMGIHLPWKLISRSILKCGIGWYSSTFHPHARILIWWSLGDFYVCIQTQSNLVIIILHQRTLKFCRFVGSHFENGGQLVANFCRSEYSTNLTKYICQCLWKSLWHL
jgi:hypothetical protein